MSTGAARECKDKARIKAESDMTMTDESKGRFERYCLGYDATTRFSPSTVNMGFAKRINIELL